MTSDLFAIAATAQLSGGVIDERFPYLTIDGIFADPGTVRAAALSLPFSAATGHYPGRVARFPQGDPSLSKFLQKVVDFVARDYVPRVPPLPGGRRLSRVRGVDTDFALTDTHPSDLSANQRVPHFDPVPVFGLVYLNQEPRGGTLFFKPRGKGRGDAERPGYPRADEKLELCGHIEGRFNRLAIYPGFILHSGEITGQWIEGEERFTSPRLTQRLKFFF